MEKIKTTKGFDYAKLARVFEMIIKYPLKIFGCLLLMWFGALMFDIVLHFEGILTSTQTLNTLFNFTAKIAVGYIILEAIFYILKWIAEKK